MKKTIALVLVLTTLFAFHPQAKNNTEQSLAEAIKTYENPKISGEEILQSMYEQFPENSFSWEAFKTAMLGKAALEQENSLPKSHLLTIVDFSKPSTQKRFFVIDTEKLEILYASLTSHGQRTGDDMATQFSNILGSHQSSLGFFKTAETYYGSKGFSMRLDGLEHGINHQARARAIVVHAANYVSQDFINRHGRLGRSQGCPALPNELNRPIIETISDGSLFFIYAPQKQYLEHSSLMQSADIDMLFVDEVTNVSTVG